MAEKLLSIRRPKSFRPSKPTFPTDLMSNDPTLDIFIGPKSWLIFDKLNANGEWLEDDVEDWQDNEEYVRMKHLLMDLKVVNDLAERCVKDVEEYANASKDPEHRDNILLVATDHRGLFQDTRKGSLDRVL